MHNPNNSKELCRKIYEIIEKNNEFLIVTHDFPDGDCIGSQIALYDLLKVLNKSALMVCCSDVPYQYAFLPHADKIKKDIETLQINNNTICFFLDSADEKRFSIDIKKIRNFSNVMINIDHHPGNSFYADINYVDSNKSATSEIIYEIINNFYKEYMNYNIALGIYTGILTDTGKFQYNNTTHNVHKIISNLLEFGVVPSSVFSSIYESEPFNRFKLLQIILRRVRIIKSKKLIYSYILDADLKKLKLPFSAHDGVIEILRSASDAKIAALFKQVKGSGFKVSLRSSDEDYNVAEIASRFGGGGHKLAAAYSHKGGLRKVISSLERLL